MMSTPTITIVVPAYNEELTLASTISALRNQTYTGTYEILIVNNASTDRTAEIAEGLGCKVVTETKQGYIHALKRGFTEATGDIIACTDADTLVAKNWLERIVGNLSNPGVVACSGAIRFSDGPLWIKFLGFVFGRCNWHLAGANMGIWRWAFEKVNGFTDKVNMGADVELGFRLLKIGKLKIDQKQIVSTSARRFQCAFFRTLILYYVNDLFLLLFRKPLFYKFANYRLDSVQSFPPALRSIVFTSFVLLFLIPVKNASTGHGDDMVYAQKSMTVALTFDDGPSLLTNRLLDILKNHNVRATFFVIGKNVEKHPEIAQRIVREGNEIGNHSYTHFLLSGFKSDEELSKELEKTSAAIEASTGLTTKLFRPPLGWHTGRMDKIREQKGYTLVNWNIDPRDWQHPSAATIVDRIMHDVKPGSIILLHDGSELRDEPELENTHVAVDALIDSLVLKGYDFVTIPQLLYENQIQRSPVANAR